MKIGILSDTHGIRKITEKVLEEDMKNVDMILHAGDLISDARHIERLNYKVHYVAGNCDPYGAKPIEKLLKIQGKRVFLTHGHVYGVKTGYGALLIRAKQLSADIVIFGHTHYPENTFIDNILFFNPGSPTLPKGGGQGTFGILEIANENINADINTIKNRIFYREQRPV